MPGGVAGILHRLAKRLFLMPQRVSVVEHAGAVVGASGQNRGASGRTHRPAGIKSLEPQSIGSHRIKVRRFECGMISVTGLPPALIVRHHEHNVRLGREQSGCRRNECDRNNKSLEHHAHPAVKPFKNPAHLAKRS